MSMPQLDWSNVQQVQQMLSEVNNLTVVLRLSLAVLLGGIIGIERGRKARPAGFRTHMLVCLGAALAMLTNQYIFQTYGVSDPVRLGAQVISGIGFLGAGTIIVTGRHQVRGLTTAAGLWASACMGLAIGVGFYFAAIVTTVAILFVTSMLHRVDEYVHSKSKVMELYVEFCEIGHVSGFMEAMREKGIRVTEIEMTKVSPSGPAGSSGASRVANASDSTVAAMMTLRSDQKRDHADILALVGRVEGVNFAERI